MKKYVFSALRWLVVLAFLLGLAWVGLLYLKKQDEAEVPQFTSAKIARGDVVQAVTATGTLNPVVNVQVGSQISGNIQKLAADFNSQVKENQVIAQLDSATYRANVLQCEGDLASSKAALELARISARRADELIKNKLIPQADVDNALATLHQAEATIKIKEANLERAKVDLERCTIYSPIDGIVISRNVDVGQTVAASMSAPVLFVIAKDLTKMQIDANVSEADVGTVEEGQDVTFTVDAFPGRTFIGKVVQVRNSPITVQNVVTYDTVIEVNNDDRKLKPGMTANVSLIVASKPGVLRIPNAALRFRPPEAPTNFTFIAKMLMTAGMKKKPEPFTNAAPAAVTSSNLLAVATTTWTGNETPDELMKKYREARDNGEVVPDSVRTKVREIFQQRGGGGGGGGQGGGQGGRGGGGPPRPSSKPATRTIWTFASSETLPPGETPKLKPVTVRTGISDGIYTEVLSGLEENSTVVTAVTLPKSTAPQQAVNPFGGGGGRGFGR